MKNLETDSTWGFHYSFNRKIDFCVWMLELDGLRVPPFDKHPQGNSILRDRGLNTEDWLRWLTLVVSLQDQRLNWRVEDNSEELLAEILTVFENMNSQHNPQINKSDLRSSLEKQMIWQNQQFNEAASQIQQFCREDNPANFWMGEPAIGELLKEFWQSYLVVINERDTPQRRLAEQTATMDKLWHSRQIYRNCLPVLQIYQVGYPKPVEYIISPASIILSVANGLPNSENFCESVVQAAENLAVLK